MGTMKGKIGVYVCVHRIQKIGSINRLLLNKMDDFSQYKIGDSAHELSNLKDRKTSSSTAIYLRL